MNEILEIIKECTSNPWFHIRKFQKSIKLPIYYSKILTYIVWESESKNPYTVGARYLESQYMELLNKWNKFFYRKKSLLTQYITSRRSYMDFLICESVNFSYYKDSKVFQREKNSLILMQCANVRNKKNLKKWRIVRAHWYQWGEKKH